MPNPSTQAPIDPNRLQTLRQELYEVENRYAELGERGLFHLLEQAHVLDHQLPDLGDVEHAMRHPPPVGRARLRGEFVQRCAQRHGTFWCDWSGLWDGQNKRMADLTDPFCAEHLDWEYGELVRMLVAKLARKRPSPLSRGDLRIWAAAAIFTVGRTAHGSRALHLRAPARRRGPSCTR